jgi:signal transduction histidine kinase
MIRGMYQEQMNGQDEVTLVSSAQSATRRKGGTHAIRKRVAAVRALARIAARDAPRPVRDHARRMEEIVCELAALIEDAAEDAAECSEHRNDTAAPAAVDVPALFEVVASQLAARCRARGVHVRFDCAPATVHGIKCDLAEAVYYLVSSALEATPKGGVVTVLTRLSDRGEHAWLFEHPGHSIPSVSTHCWSKRKGGAGLALAAATMARHGGMLNAHLTHNGGTRIAAWLPAGSVA